MSNKTEDIEVVGTSIPWLINQLQEVHSSNPDCVCYIIYGELVIREKNTNTDLLIINIGELD